MPFTKQAPKQTPGAAIACAQAAAQAVIDRHVDAEKVSNPGVPRESILQMTMAKAQCPCRVAQLLLEKEAENVCQ
jgi:hypothetical protein